MMRIVGIRVRRELLERQEPGGDFTFVPVEALEGDQLSLPASGLLMDILSCGDAWDLGQARADELQRRKSGIEEEHIDALLVELEKAGYLTIVRG